MIKTTKGNIFISNQNLRNIDLKSLRSKLGIVFQDSYLINDTIAANIALGEKNIDKTKVKESLIKANAYEFVKNLKEGIDEKILERGSRFSGGERQRLALARALYKDPKILIMDEPTSALDQNGERIFLQSLKKIIGTITIIIISHKENILESCDKVIKINKEIITIKQN